MRSVIQLIVFYTHRIEMSIKSQNKKITVQEKHPWHMYMEISERIAPARKTIPISSPAQ
jgi:hypothetical protein